MTVEKIIDKCKHYDSDFRPEDTAMSVDYIFGKLIPIIEKKAAEDERKKCVEGFIKAYREWVELDESPCSIENEKCQYDTCVECFYKYVWKGEQI